MQKAIKGFEIRCISSLEKVFADEELQASPLNKASALLGETYSFQVGYRSDRLIKPLQFQIESMLGQAISIRSVGLVPSELPCYSDHDDLVLRVQPGIYPDPLFPIEEYPLTALPEWRSIWVSVDLRGNITPKSYSLRVKFEDVQGEELGQETFHLEVLPSILIPQRLIHTEWFHADCLAVQYGVEVFSNDHWDLIHKYVRTAVDHGINMILTPLFTPPLDTAIGGERPTVQLIDVECLASGEYRFTFDKLLQWITLCVEVGIEYFEFSHLFTQWGAKHAPKIMASTPEGMLRIFGWETDAAGPEYERFLSRMLPELAEFIRSRGWKNRCYFHISDEPSKEHLDTYRSAASIVNKYLDGFPVIDALSDYRFYEQGLVRNPIPAVDHLDAFLVNQVPDLWTYYCCAQSREVTNRFFNMASVRNRIIGMQLYKFRIKGFLHWGYNFWFTQYSLKPIDPFLVTDAGLAFPSGDAFLVYPGSKGPIESIRLKVFHDALQDLRALQKLEELIGRERVIELLEEDLEQELTFKHYPMEPEWLLTKREQINRLIAEKMLD